MALLLIEALLEDLVLKLYLVVPVQSTHEVEAFALLRLHFSLRVEPSAVLRLVTLALHNASYLLD